MIKQMTIAQDDGAVTVLTPKPNNYTRPDIGLVAGPNCYRVLHDWELPEFDYKPRQLDPEYEQRKPMPATRQLWGGETIHDFWDMSEEWQWWLHSLIRRVAHPDVPDGHYTQAGTVAWAYADLIANHRAFTDNNAPELGRADYVTGRNIGARPYGWKRLVTTGNIVKVIGSNGKYYIIETINLSQPPPDIDDVIRKPWLIQWATEQSVTELPRRAGKRRWVVSNFPQIEITHRYHGYGVAGTPQPVFGRHGTNLILKHHVVPIDSGQVFSPYEPAAV